MRRKNRGYRPTGERDCRVRLTTQALDRDERVACRDARKIQAEAEYKRRAGKIQIHMTQIDADRARDQAKIEVDKELSSSSQYCHLLITKMLNPRNCQLS